MASTFPDLGPLQRTVESLSARVAALEQTPANDSSDAISELAAVADLTNRVFGISPAIKPTVDPESGSPYIVVQVRAVGTDEEILERARTWHRVFADEFATATRYSLSVLFE
jgi:hypothetical protein